MVPYEYTPDINHYMDVKVVSGMNVGDVFYEDVPIGKTWEPVVFGNYPEQRGRRRKPEGDFPSSGYSPQPLMTDQAWQALKPLIGDCCELLPCVHPTGGTYWLVHVLKSIDALDDSRAEVVRFDDGEIMRVKRFAFHEERIKGHPIFKLPHRRGNALIIGDEFRKIVEANDLKGLLFHPLPMVDRE